jgi:hypothetical protein
MDGDISAGLPASILTVDVCGVCQNPSEFGTDPQSVFTCWCQSSFSGQLPYFKSQVTIIVVLGRPLAREEESAHCEMPKYL